MIHPEAGLYELARRFRQGLPPGAGALREAFENGLAVLIRRAVTSGHGPTALLHWLKNQRGDPAGQGIRFLSQKLAERLSSDFDPVHARETVAGP